MFEWQAQCLTVGQVLQGGNLVYSGEELNESLLNSSFQLFGDFSFISLLLKPPLVLEKLWCRSC